MSILDKQIIPILMYGSNIWGIPKCTNYLKIDKLFENEDWGIYNDNYHRERRLTGMGAKITPGKGMQGSQWHSLAQSKKTEDIAMTMVKDEDFIQMTMVKDGDFIH